MTPEHDAQLSLCEEKFKQLDHHIEQGEKWRLAIIGIVFLMAVQLGSFLYMWGSLRTEVGYIGGTLNQIVDKLSITVKVTK